MSPRELVKKRKHADPTSGSGNALTPPQTGLDGTSVLGREAFATISAVEGIALSEEAHQMFADFDARGVPHDERRRAIIERFKGETR
jgi:hypothetical protein